MDSPTTPTRLYHPGSPSQYFRRHRHGTVALPNLDAEDRRKLHAEVNQIVNQRILITTFSVTVFGVMTSWMIPKTAPPANAALELFTYIGSAILSIMLLVLFLLSIYQTNMLRISPRI